jgi:Apea-like HEPN
MDLNQGLSAFSNFIETLRFDDQLKKDSFEDSLVLIQRGDRTIILVGDDAEKYREITSAICSAASERRPVSKRAVSGLLDDFFMKMLGSGDATQNPLLGDQLKSEARTLKQALFEKPKNWEVQLTVEGLSPNGLPITVGSVEFRHLNETSLSDLRYRVTGLVKDLNVQNSDAAVAHLAGNLDVLREKVVGVLTVNAVDDEGAILAAKRELQSTLDALNFFAVHENLGGWAFLPGDTMPQREFVLAICEDGRLTPSFRRVGPGVPIAIGQMAKRKGFLRVSEMLRAQNPTDLEQRVLASLEWAGRAQIEARREEAFLLYAIALESLLLARDTKTEIAQRLAIRCAQLGGGPTLNDKKLVVEQILSLYQIRSDIVHSGNFLVREDELSLIRTYAVLTLFLILDSEPFRSMREVRELESWFQTQLLSGGVSRT